MDACITKILPEISKKKLKQLKVELNNLGVKIDTDLQYVKEKDLVNVLKPVEVRKLLKLSQSGNIM